MNYDTIVVTGWRGAPRSGGKTRLVYGMPHEYVATVRREVMDALLADPRIPRRLLVGDANGVDEVVRDITPPSPLRPAEVFVADWKGLGHKAGPARNRAMLEAAGPNALVLAFPVPESRGTADCVKQAIALGLDVRVFSLRSRSSS